MGPHREIPLLKEARLSKLLDVAECFDKYPLDRDRQRLCILALYKGKSEKSVFRGMVIPTLRSLGFIVGFGNEIRLSANAKLLLKAKANAEIARVASALFLELDQGTFNLISHLEGAILRVQKRKQERSVGIPKDEFVESEADNLEGPSTKQKRERVKKWLSLLIDSHSISQEEGLISVNGKVVDNAKHDLSPDAKRAYFKKTLFGEYGRLPTQENAGIVDVADIREKVALSLYDHHKMILTERQFDELLRGIPLASEEYVISLGQPMGAEEKLFSLKGNYYRTISITTFARSTRK